MASDDRSTLFAGFFRHFGTGKSGIIDEKEKASILRRMESSMKEMVSELATLAGDESIKRHADPVQYQSLNQHIQTALSDLTKHYRQMKEAENNPRFYVAKKGLEGSLKKAGMLIELSKQFVNKKELRFQKE